MKKRIVSFLMALVMAVSLLPVQVFAASSPTVVGGKLKQSIEYVISYDDDENEIYTPAKEGDEASGCVYIIGVPSTGTDTLTFTLTGNNTFDTTDFDPSFMSGTGENFDYQAEGITLSEDKRSIEVSLKNAPFPDSEAISQNLPIFSEWDQFNGIYNKKLHYIFAYLDDGDYIDILIYKAKPEQETTEGPFDFTQAFFEATPAGSCTAHPAVFDGDEEMSGFIKDQYPVYFARVSGDTKEITKTTNGSAYYDFNSSLEGWPSSGPISHDRADTVFCVAADDYEVTKSAISLTSVTLSEDADHLLFFVCDDDAEHMGYFLVEWLTSSNTLTDEQKKPLADLLATVADGNTNYYQSGDRYNDKTKNTSTKGFWTEFTAANGPRAKAQKALKTATTEAEINAATAALQAAIDNLIPTSQLNPTRLYEVVQQYKSYTDEWFENFTENSVVKFKAKLAEAEAYLDSLFDDNGNPTAENVPENQKKADGYPSAVSRMLVSIEGLGQAQDHQKTVNSLLKQYPMTANNGVYTEASWDAFVAARDAAKEYFAQYPATEEGYGSAPSPRQYSKLTKNLLQAVYGLTPAAEQITVTLIYTDDYHLRVPDSKKTDPAGNKPGTQKVTLTSGATIGDLMKKTGYTYAPDFGSNKFEGVHLEMDKLLVNGVILNGVVQPESATPDINYVLRDGDVVQFVHMDWPSFEFNYIYRDAPDWVALGNKLKVMRFGGASAQTAKTGVETTVTVEATSAHLWTYNGIYSAYAGAEIAVYGPRNEDGTYPEKAILTGKLTDAAGQASFKLYNEGVYLVTAFESHANDSNSGYYPSAVVAAPYLELTVTANEDGAGIKADLKAELDKAYKTYPESYFRPETWEKLKAAYDKAAEILTSTDAAVSAAYDAQKSAIKEIKGYQAATTAENEKNLTTFRTALNKLPDNTALLTVGVKSTVDELIGCYDGMSDYQRRQLTGAEKAKYDKIKAFADANETFPADEQYNLKLNVVADTPAATAALNEMVTYLREHPVKQDRGPGGGGDYTTAILTATPFSFIHYKESREPLATFDKIESNKAVQIVTGLEYAAYFQTRDADGTFTVDGAKWSISDEGVLMDDGPFLGYNVYGDMIVTIDGVPYAVESITYDGIDASKVRNYDRLKAYDVSGYKGKNDQWINMRFDNAMKSFTMPYNDVTVTITWAPVGDTLSTVKQAAQSRLQTLYNSLGGKADEAYQAGVKAITAAKTAAAVDKAYQAAVKDMQSAAANYGKVQVIVENTTFTSDLWPDGEKYWDGTLVDTWVDLSADSTMMSCVAAALKTVNANSKGVESGYIASINGLGEFDGSGSAGWMGTLNDWFTNVGFSEFTVAKGNLADGDVIRVMFTSSGYGADLGGTWGNSDTTVKALTVDGAMLTPNFIPGEAGGQYDYTLIIDGESASVKLTPTASNKNFQVKTFLNEKVTDRSEGSSFYKRTETIPVKVGDTIYLGCGAKNWLSMNNQAGNKQNSDGTWYALHVVNSNTGANYVTDLIAKLPTSLKYETYTRSMNDVAAARAAYGVLAKSEQGKVTNLAKLVNLEKQIEGFTAVDAFKVQLAALPEAEKLSVNDREAVDAAEAAYRTLTDALKDCLTVAEKEKAETVFDKMAEIKGNVVLAVEKQIDAIGEVTLENEAAVRAAQAAYDALTAEQKQLVNSEKVAALNAAVAKLAELKRVKLLAEMGDIYASVGESLQAQVNKSAPIVGSIGGEWLALGLARSDRSVPAGYYDNVVQYVKANVNANERLHNSKSTDNSRVILALTAIGKDPTNVGGHNLLKGLDSMSYINKQGINGPVFALIALDSHNYPTFGEVTRDVLIDRILSEQVKADGGWALGGADEKASDVDVTAMTIQALAPYYKTNAKVKTAVDKGLTWLSEHQQEDGGFASWGAVNSESCAQVIVALAALGIDPLTDSRFIKNGITALDALCGYYTQDDTLGKGFAHVKQSSGGYVGGAYNQMATEQAYYALNAYYRFANSQNRLYDMTDVCITHNFGAWTVTKVATCTESGISTRKCSVCGTEETMIVPSLGHSMTATAGKAATCTGAGNSAYWSCSRCGKFFSDAAGKTEIAKDSWVIAALGHDEATRGAVAATCYISGHEEDTYCKRCGIVLTAGATIPATGKHTYVNGVCTVCGVKNPAGGIKGDDLKVDSKDNKTVSGGGLVIKAEVTVDDEKLMEIKAAVENGSITVKVDNEKAVQTTDEQKKTDGGKSALEAKANAADTPAEVKNELTKLIDKLADMRKDNSGKKDAQIEKVVDVAVELVKTVNGQVTSVAQLIELPQSVTVTISITDEMYNSLLNRKVCVVRSHTDANGNVTTTELPAYLGGTEGNRVLSFQTDKASTFAIVSYETVSTGGGSGSGSITVVKPTSANTADDSQMVIWLGSAVMAAAAVVVLTRKQKRVSK